MVEFKKSSESRRVHMNDAKFIGTTASDLRIYKTKYDDTKRIAILLMDGNIGEPFAMLSINIPNEDCNGNVFFVDTNNIDISTIFQIFDTDLFDNTFKFAKSGYFTYPKWKLKENTDKTN